MLTEAVKQLIDELKVSFPVDGSEAQVLLTNALISPEVIRCVRNQVQLNQMEDDSCK
jgi:hypothetical protein